MDDIENIKFLLSLWGAGLSTLLAVLAIVKFRRESKVNLMVIGVVDSPFEKLRVEICNRNNKPATLKSLKIGIGTTRTHATLLKERHFNTPIKLNESEIHVEHFERSELKQLVREKQVTQKQFQRIFLTLTITTGKKFYEVVYINPQLIDGDYYKKAEQFIATDIFLGFKKMDSEAYPIGINK